jgi:membrane protein
MRELLDMVEEFLEDMRGTRKLSKEHHVPVLASSVAFFSIFSLCPLLILSFLLSRVLLRNINAAPPEAPQQLLGVLESILPSPDPTVRTNVFSILQANAIGNTVNIALLLWSSYELFGVLHHAFDQMSVRGKDRNTFWTNFVSLLCFLVVTGASSILLVLSTVDISVLKVVFREYLAGWDPLSLKLIGGVLGTMCVIASITFVYKLMPTQKIRLIHAIRGSVLFLTMFFLGRMAYSLYVLYYKYVNEGVYGPFSTFIMVVAWIYFLARIFLFSGQYTIYLEEKERHPHRL